MVVQLWRKGSDAGDATGRADGASFESQQQEEEGWEYRQRKIIQTAEFTQFRHVNPDPSSFVYMDTDLE